MNVHSPARPGSVQDSNCPVHALLQQTPLAQNVEAHCVPLMQDSPRASGVGVEVGVAVGVGVLVDVAEGVAVDVAVTVAVGVGVNVTQLTDCTSQLAFTKSSQPEPQMAPVSGLQVVTSPPSLQKQQSRIGVGVGVGSGTQVVPWHVAFDTNTQLVGGWLVQMRLEPETHEGTLPPMVEVVHWQQSSAPAEVANRTTRITANTPMTCEPSRIPTLSTINRRPSAPHCTRW